MPSERSWHKASYSAGTDNCVEVREGLSTAIRDTRYRERGHVDVPAGEWVALVTLLGMTE